MFTGIISAIGTVKSVIRQKDIKFVLTSAPAARGLILGASIACDGACLTVVEKGSGWFAVEASAETLARSTLGTWKKGSRVNLERALKAGDELGGHIVTGHVDSIATLTSIKPSGASKILAFSAPKSLSRFIAAKGSVTLNGVSLTVNQVKGTSFTVNIIPHTLKSTTLGACKPGDKLNLEIDLIARYLDRFAAAR